MDEHLTSALAMNRILDIFGGDKLSPPRTVSFGTLALWERRFTVLQAAQIFLNWRQDLRFW
jgi:hypothetical protein